MKENNPPTKYNSDVRVITLQDREIILVGTAHISQQSADLVRTVIETEKPDCVCVELDQQRFKALSEKKKWESLDLKSVIREKQLSTLLINILLASYQKKLGQKLGVTPGAELIEATKVAKENDIPVELADRDIRITLRRAWNTMSFWQKMKLLSYSMVGMFENEEITEETLEKLRQKDVLTELMTELGKAMPVLKTVLIDERDSYLAEKIKNANGKKIVAVVGAGHVQGINERLLEETPFDLDKINVIPKISPVWKTIGWGIPVVIIASIIYIGFTKGPQAAGDNVIFWILINGIPSSLGTLVAFGHPLTILSALLAAPVTSLTPVIGAGYVAAFVQAYVKPPVVKEFQTVAEDAGKLKCWWKNRLLRIFLVFIMAGIGSAIGTYVGAAEIISNLF